MNIKTKNNFFINLAYNQAEINLGSTLSNPSVGCIVVKNNSVISSGRTSLNGKPHAEANALKKKINFKNSFMYSSLEPCSHYGKTPPCTKKIIEKKIQKVFYSTADVDVRSSNKAKKILNRNKIKVKKSLLLKKGKIFYESYFLQKKNSLPFIDAKLAMSNDYLTINKKKKWITNNASRKVGHLLRSRYNCIISTSKTINEDNSLLNCRIEGMEEKSPSVVIIDRFLKLKKNLKILKSNLKKIYIFTQVTDETKKKFFKKKGVIFLKYTSHDSSIKEFNNIFKILKKRGFHRIFVESGTIFINLLIKNNFLKNLYLFQSPLNLGKEGKNNSSIKHIKKARLNNANKIQVNLNGDSLFRVNIEHV